MSTLVDSLKFSLYVTTPFYPLLSNYNNYYPPRLRRKPNYYPPRLRRKPKFPILCSVTPDPWSLSDGNRDLAKLKPKWKNPKKPLSDDNARRIIKSKAQYLSALRRNQGPKAQTPKWIKRSPEQMVQYLEDDRNGHLYGKLVVAAIMRVRSLSQKRIGEYDMRMEMASFVGKLSFREMCVVLKEQKSWRQVRDFFSWMKLQLSYRPSVIIYTILLRNYGQVGKIKMAEETFLEMLEVGCEPDEVACGTMLCTYARWGRHKAMLSFYSAVKERGIILPISVFNFMLSSLQKKALHGKVIDLWRQMLDRGVALNAFSYTVVISSLAKENLLEEAFGTFKEMKNIGFVPEEVTYSLLISLSIKMGKKVEALRLYEDMRDKGITPSNYTCASLLALFYKNEDYSKALSLFAEMERKKIAADEVIYGLLIRIYGKLGLYEDARKTFREIEHLGLLTDGKTYLAMAQVHLNSGNVKNALKTLEQMKSRNIWFSRFAYIVMLQCYVVKEDLSSAEETFEALSKTGLPDAGSCTDMLSLYIRLDLTEKSKKFIARIRKDQVIFDEVLFKSVMTVYCKGAMLSDAKKLIEEMKSNELFKANKFVQTFLLTSEGEENKKIEGKLAVFDQPDTRALTMMLQLYLAAGEISKGEKILKLLLGREGGLLSATQLISTLIRQGDELKAEILINALTKLGSRPDDATMASLISLYGKQQKLKQAEELFEAAADSSLSEKLYNAMIDAYAKCGELDKAYMLYNHAIEKGFDLGAVSASILVNALTNSGKHHKSETIILKNVEAGLALDTVAFNTFIKAMLEAGKLHFASSIYDKMIGTGVAPSIQTYNTMISVYGRGRKLDKAVEMFNTARRSSVSLDEKAYTNMISFYGKAGKTLEASQLFTEMLESGIKPGMVCYDIMMNIYAADGLHQEAHKLFTSMETKADSFIYLSLIRAYTESWKFKEAEEIIKSMKINNIPLTCAHFNLLLSALVKGGMIKEAERVYEDLMISSGINPDLICTRTMLRGYMDYGYVEEGIKLFKRLDKFAKGDMFISSVGVHLYRSVGNEIEALGVLNSMNSMNSMRIKLLENLQVGSKLATRQSTSDRIEE